MNFRIFCCVSLIYCFASTFCTASEGVYKSFADALCEDDVQIAFISTISVEDVLRWMNEDPETYKVFEQLLKIQNGSIHITPFFVEEYIGDERFSPFLLLYNPMTMEKDAVNLPAVPGSEWIVAIRKASGAKDQSKLLKEELKNSVKLRETLMILDYSEECYTETAINLIWPEDAPQALAGYVMTDTNAEILVDEFRKLYAFLKMDKRKPFSGERDVFSPHLDILKSDISRGIAKFVLPHSRSIPEETLEQKTEPADIVNEGAGPLRD